MRHKFCLALLHRQTCVYMPNTLYYYMKQGVFFIVCSRLSEPQWPLKIRRHGHFKGVLVLVIYHVAHVELLVAILRVRTQERVCGPKGNTRTYKKLWALPNNGWEKKWITTHTRYRFILCGFLLPISYRKKNDHKQVFHIRLWFAANTNQRYMYSSQTRRATAFQSCPPGNGKESLRFLLAQR